MKFLRGITSGRVTLLIVAVVAAVYVFSTFGNENPLYKVLTILNGKPVSKILIVFIAIHFFLKGAGSVYRGGRRYSVSAGFFISVAVVIAGILISTDVRETEMKKVVVSEISGPLKIKDIHMELPQSLLLIGDSSEFVIKDPRVVIEGRGGEKIVGPFPFVRTLKGMSYINDVGLSPYLVIHSGGSVFEVDKIQLLPPGNEVFMHLGGGVKAAISIAHEKEFKKGRLLAKQYNLVEPEYRVLIKRGTRIIFDEIVKEKEERMSGTIRVQNRGTHTWAEMVFVKDPAVYVIYTGLLGIGICMLLFPLEFYARYVRR